MHWWVFLKGAGPATADMLKEGPGGWAGGLILHILRMATLSSLSISNHAFSLGEHLNL